jgi:phosphate:Na+ symporter
VTAIQALLFVIGGLALLLAGVDGAADSFRVAGPGLRSRLLSVARNPLESLLFGAILSGITQSSSAAASFAVGLTDVGLLSSRGALLVMMGTSVGAAATLFLFALDTASLAPALFAAGFFLGKGRRRSFAVVGGVLRGVGLILGGMALLRLGAGPLLALPQVRSVLAGASALPPLLFLLALALTGILQSSSAVLALAMTLVSGGALPREAVIPVALGAHVGSAGAVLLTALGGKRSARRLAAATLLYKAAGALLFLPLAPLVLKELRDTPPNLLVPLFLSALTVCNALVGLPAAGLLERLSSRWFASSVGPGDPIYLDDRLLPYPEVALSLLAREMGRCAGLTMELADRLVAPEEGERDRGRMEELGRGLPDLITACEEYLKDLPGGGEPELIERHRALSLALGPLRRVVLSIARELLPLWRCIPRPDPELIRRFREALAEGLSAFAAGEKPKTERVRDLCSSFTELARDRGGAVTESLFGAEGEELSVLWAAEDALILMERIALAARDLACPAREREPISSVRAMLTGGTP